MERVLKKGAIVESMDLRRYKDGRTITSMPCGETVAREYGAPWMYVCSRLVLFSLGASV
jgi:salicylate hydroxylase